MIESLSQAGHRRRITSAQLAAQSVSSLCSGGTSLELCHGVDLPTSEPEAELLPPEGKVQLKENSPSRLQLLRV